MKFYAASAEESLKKLGSSPDGLSSAEAEKRLQEYGPNKFQEHHPPSLLHIFISQFKSFIVFILIAALVISALLGEWVDAVVIGVIVIFNALFGTFQEYRAEKAMEALEQMTAPHAKVLRNGRERVIPADGVVPGDIVVLDAGDAVPADVRIIQAFSLHCNEAALTGESVPDAKFSDSVGLKATVGDRNSMAYAHTTVTSGHGKGLVTATGMHTEMGKIAGMIQTIRDTETPMTRRLNELGKKLGALVLIISTLLFLIEIVETPAVLGAFLSFSGDISALAASLEAGGIMELFLVAVSLAVSAIPEGLPAVVTVTLALGLKRMAGEKAVVRKLPAVETLGSTTVICTDKTGTLTRNEMMVTHLYAGGKEVNVTGEGYATKGEFSSPLNAELKRLLFIAAHCNDAELIEEDNAIIGDPTEGALAVAAEKAGISKGRHRVDELPFDSHRKLMTTIHDSRGLMAMCKGAPETVLGICESILINGKEMKLTPAMRKRILETNLHWASGALRNLGFAYKKLKHGYEKGSVEKGMVFVGLAGMIDSARPEAKFALAKCRTAGIRVIMITGDNPATAVAIGRELGLIEEGDVSLTGAQVERMSDEALRETVDDVSVFARVSPEHKLRIVQALQARGEVVAVTGDGVNDAPALKTADIGIAMGITGTDVSKEASDIILEDDNFATIVKAVEEGRRVYGNIKNFIKYLLSANFDEIIVVAVAAFVGWPLPFIPVQILWINLITDGFPALALGMDPPDPDVMKDKPRLKEESVFHGILPVIIMAGGLAAISSLIGFWYGLPDGIEKARTMAFTISVLFELGFVFNCRSAHQSVFNGGFLSNKWLLAAVGLGLVLQLSVIYIPFLQVMFGTAPLGAVDWVIVLVAASLGMVPLLGNMWRKGKKA